MNFDVEKFSYRLTVLLDENNMNQTDLANKIGISNVTICRYLTGNRMPRLDVIAKMASVFDVSIDYLLALSEDKKPQKSELGLDYNYELLIKKLFALDKSSHLSKKQIELIKKLLLANKDFILSAS